MKSNYIAIEMIFLDLLSLPALIVLFSTYFKVKKYRLRLEEKEKELTVTHLKYKKNDYIGFVRALHFKAFLLRYSYAVKAIFQIIIGAFLLLISILFLWRLPTLYIILRTPEFLN